jgi:hypothetical protein
MYFNETLRLDSFENWVSRPSVGHICLRLLSPGNEILRGRILLQKLVADSLVIKEISCFFLRARKKRPWIGVSIESSSPDSKLALISLFSYSVRLKSHIIIIH